MGLDAPAERLHDALGEGEPEPAGELLPGLSTWGWGHGNGNGRAQVIEIEVVGGQPANGFIDPGTDFFVGKLRLRSEFAAGRGVCL